MTMYLFRCVLLSIYLLLQEAGPQKKDGEKDATGDKKDDAKGGKKDGDKDVKGGKKDGDKDAKGGKSEKKEKKEEPQPKKDKKEKKEETQQKKDKKEKDIDIVDRLLSGKAEGGASSTQDFDHMCMVVHQKQIGGMKNYSLCTRSSNRLLPKL